MTVPVGTRPATAGQDSPPPAVRLAAVGKRYGEQWALRDVSMEIAPGSFTVLLGASGSGKSTLVRLLAGIDRPSAGEISLDGQVVAGERVHVPPQRRDLAMVFQDYALWPHLTVRQNVAFALRRRRLAAGQASTSVQEMVGKVGLAAKLDRYPSELSGGEQQRVALARALVARTSLVLFDEPLSNLDADLRERLRLTITTLVREAGTTAVYITHDQVEAFAVADQIGILRSGRLVQTGPPEDVYARPGSAFVARFTGLSGELPVTSHRPAGPGLAEVSVAGITLLAKAGLDPDAADPGEAGAPAARLLMRPAAVRFTHEQPGSLPGRVLDAAFRGHGYDHLIEVVGGHRLVAVFAERRQPPGSRVAVALDPEGCHLFAGPGGGSDAAPPGPEAGADLVTSDAKRSW